MKIRGYFKRAWARFQSYGFNLLTLSVLTGLFVGVVVTFYTVLTSLGEDFAGNCYRLLREYPAFIPLLFVVLAAGAIVIGTLVKFVPMIRGSGIPQIEGAARGILVFRWYVVLCSMFAASLACVCLGLSAGSEGPSVEMGGCAGDAVGSAFRRSQMIRRLQIASGASAGFAVAFNAPVTGMIFALEEAFRSFAPQVFICSAVSVVTALLTRGGIRAGLNAALGVEKFSSGFSFDRFVFVRMDVAGFGFVVLASLVVALAAVGFYYLMFAVKKLFKKITFFKGTGKYLIPFLFAGAAGLITVYATGGGHSFIESLSTGGTGNIGTESVFGMSLIASLAVIVLLRFVAMTLIMGAAVPCGVFVPMLAVGAGLGGVLSLAFRGIGFDAAYSDYLIIICMSVFFTTFVRAPITGLCMVFELTGQMQNLLPALLGVTIGYVVSGLAHLEPGYERLLHMFIEEEGYYKNLKKVRLEAVVQPRSQADGGKVRKIIWPTDGLVVKLVRSDGSSLVPDGETILYAGDTITFECDTSDVGRLKEYLYEIVGKPERMEQPSDGGGRDGGEDESR